MPIAEVSKFESLIGRLGAIRISRASGDDCSTLAEAEAMLRDCGKLLSPGSTVIPPEATTQLRQLRARLDAEPNGFIEVRVIASLLDTLLGHAE